MEIYGGTAGTASPVTFTQPPVAQGEIDSLRNEMSRYAATIDELYARLDPVLKPEYAEPSEKLSTPMPVVSEIATLRSQLAENTSRLNALILRVDL